MNTQRIRQKLQNYLEVTDNKKVKAIYVIMEDDIKEANIKYSVVKKELDDRYNNYKNGNSKLISAAQSKKRINKILSGTIE